MNLRALLCGVAFAGGWLVSTAPALSQYEKSEKQREGTEAKEGGEDEMMLAWMKMGAPGEHHKHLEAFVGHWETVVKFRMAAEAPWMESKGTSTLKWVLGGRFLMEEVESEMMGQPFHGLGYSGYDNFRKQYVSLWMDSMMTGVHTSTGTCDTSGKVFTYHGKTDDPMTGERDKPYKMTLRVVNPDKTVTEMWMNGPDGKEFMSMEIVYTRK